MSTRKETATSPSSQPKAHDSVRTRAALYCFGSLSYSAASRVLIDRRLTQFFSSSVSLRDFDKSGNCDLREIDDTELLERPEPSNLQGPRNVAIDRYASVAANLRGLLCRSGLGI